MDLEPTDRIEDVKAKIQEEEGVPPDQAKIDICRKTIGRRILCKITAFKRQYTPSCIENTSLFR